MQTTSDQAPATPAPSDAAPARPKRKRVVTEKMIAANRANARKSTGPITPEGKARARRNAIKHGLLARHVLLADPDDPAEDPAEFDALRRALHRGLRPTDPAQGVLVDRIAGCYWRLGRAYRHESSSILDLRRAVDEPLHRMTAQLTGEIVDPTKYILPRDKDLERLIRYETMIDRELHRALRQFYLSRRLESLLSDPRLPAPGVSGMLDGRRRGESPGHQTDRPE